MIGNEYVLSSNLGYEPDPKENVKDSLFEQYERVIMESLITSFGLDFILRDQHGGDVDTIHNVRQIGIDQNMTYKSKINEAAYVSKEKYDSHSYHSHPDFYKTKKEIAIQKANGTLRDEYSGKKIGKNEIVHIDHVISAKEISEDRGRVLSGLKGEDLANARENLKATTAHTNLSKNSKTMHQYVNDNKDNLSKKEQQTMLEIDRKSRNDYNQKIAKHYYTSTNFGKAITKSSFDMGIKMGIREAAGLVFAEIWFAIKDEFKKHNGRFDMETFFTSLKNSVINGIENAKRKYRELLARFKDGLFAGAMSSITTTLINIFFTTSKNIGKIIRKSWASLVQAAKIIFVNPDNLPFGDKMRAVAKILATGASVIIGTIVSEAISKTPLGTIPVVGTIASTFCGTLVSGILSCSFLYFMDHSKIIQKIVNFLNGHSFGIESVREMLHKIDEIVAIALNINIEQFEQEIREFKLLSQKLYQAKNATELNTILKQVYNEMHIELPWGNQNFNSFMMDRNSTLKFC